MAPPLPDGTDVALAVGALRYLADAGLITWQPDQPYPAGFTGVAGFLASWPAEPACVVACTPYPVADDPEQSMSRIGLQIRTRWDGSNPRGVMNLSAAVFDQLHGLGPVVLPGGVSVSQCLRASGGSMGQDGSSKRWSWSDNYYVDVDRPSTHRN